MIEKRRTVLTFACRFRYSDAETDTILEEEDGVLTTVSGFHPCGMASTMKERADGMYEKQKKMMTKTKSKMKPHVGKSKGKARERTVKALNTEASNMRKLREPKLQKGQKKKAK